jgi:hypothetical protein
MLIDLFDDEQEDPNDFVSFIVFEPASLRIPDSDLLLIGDPVSELFENVMASPHFNNTIQDQTLINRLQRIEMMIDLLKSNDGLILTKFLNNIWRRYAFFSNLGELFLTQRDLNRLVPDATFKEKMILDRFIETPDDNDATTETTNQKNDDTNTTDTSDKKADELNTK